MYGLALLFTLFLAIIATSRLLPMVAVRLQLGVLLAADDTTLAPAMDANKIALVTSAFALGETLVIGDLTFAAGNGLDPILGAAGAQEVAQDPVTGSQLITLKAATSAGFRWVTSGGLAVPITVYGYALIDNGATVLLGAELLVTPITVDADGLQIQVDPVTMTFVQNPVQ